jgi:predicted metal-dependent peptidase
LTTLTPTQRSLTKGKIKARGWMPYLSHVLAVMRTHVTEDVPTMSVDESARLYINEAWVANLSSAEVAYCLLHEVLHVVLSHGKRLRTLVPDGGERERFCWNVSADLCIQQMLARQLGGLEPQGIVRIDGVLPGVPGDIRFLDIPGLARGMSTEQYYGLLLPFFPEEQDEGRPRSTLDPRDAGSNSSGSKGKDEQPASVIEEAMLHNALEQAERDMESAAPGSVPGGLRKSLSLRLRPQPDPFEELTRVVSRSIASPVGTDEYTYRRLSRRQMPDAARKRGVVRYAPECSIIVDTSGSMSGCEEKALIAVSQGLQKVQQPRVVLYDHAVQDERRMSHLADFQWKGYGGTDMTTAIEMVDAKHRPDAIVCITDGETHWPTKPTRARLIIALVRPSNYGTPPSWARVVACYTEVARFEH